MADILIIEDDRNLSRLLSMHLEDQGHTAVCIDTAAGAEALLAARGFDLVLLDYQLPDGDGLGLLPRLKRAEPPPAVIMITGVSDTAVAIEAMQLGAFDYIRKPMDQAELSAAMTKALEARRQTQQAPVVAPEEEPVSINSIVGESRAIIELCKTLGRVAASEATVLITGESGTGKEVVARALHHHSGRSGAFVPINCSAIVETLLESELFGHEKGSFTGAVARKPGKFELAAEGTLFLDEIGEMVPGLQAKLLRVLQERRFERVGGTESLASSARIIAATHRDLPAMVREGSFREDLYYRLNVVALHLPPLRERPEDLPVLVEHLLRKANRELRKSISRISAAAWRKLGDHRWPGNVRELENVILRAVVLAPQDIITPDLLLLPAPGAVAEQGEGLDEEDLVTLDRLEERHVRAVITYTRWHKGKACEILGISRPALERKLQKYGIK